MYQTGKALSEKSLVRSKALDFYYISMALHLTLRIVYFICVFFYTDYNLY